MDTKNCTESSSNGIAIENDHTHSGFKWIYPLNMVIFQNSSGITSYFIFFQAAGMLAVGALMAGRIMDTV
jgi:hypothetical protein